MSLFSSLYTGVNGLNAQSKQTASISNNIANVSTIGYKKTDTVFHDLVVNNTKPARFASGGVFTDTIRRIDRQGQLQQTASATELGISGGGFFVVRKSDDADAEYLYTRNGTFSPDSEGLLRNAAGFILYGWPVDEQGNVSAGNTLASLQAVDVDEFNNFHRQTSQVELSLNLNGAETPINTQVTGQPLPADAEAAHFSRSVKVVDGTGTARNLTFEYRKVTGPMAYATSQALGLQYTDSLTDPGIFGGIADGDTFDVNGLAVTIVAGPADTGANEAGTVGELIQVLRNAGYDATLTGDGRFLLRATDLTSNIDISASSAGVTGANGFSFFGDPNTPYTPIQAATYPDQGDLPALVNAVNPNPHGWWELTVRTDNAANPIVTQGLINFNSNGTLNTQPNAVMALDVDFDNAGAEDNTSLAVTLTATQFAGGYNVLVANHNGAEAGTLMGVNIDREGRVMAKFSNNETFQIYQIPLATFVNPNGLEARTGTVFAQTQDAGDLEITEAGIGGAGIIQSAAVEASNVDLANEFAELIVSQRAFQANSKIISTVDEMTQLLRQMKG